MPLRRFRQVSTRTSDMIDRITRVLKVLDEKDAMAHSTSSVGGIPMTDDV